MRSYLKSALEPYCKDQQWFDAVCIRYNENSPNREELRVKRYARWATYVKNNYPWNHTSSQGAAGPRGPTLPGKHATPFMRPETIEIHTTFEEVDCSDDNEVEHVQHEVKHSPKPHLAQSPLPRKELPIQPGSYRWDLAYLRISISGTNIVKMVALGSLVPEGHAMDCHYLIFKHTDLLNRLPLTELAAERDIKYQLIYSNNGQDFDLADPDGYICALGAFSTQSRPEKCQFEAMPVVFQSISYSKQTPQDPCANDSLTECKREDDKHDVHDDCLSDGEASNLMVNGHEPQNKRRRI